MGNQLASLSHQPDNTIALPEGVTFEDRLGGGQFLRTLKCGSEDGALVVKVYSKRESRTALSSYEEMLAVANENGFDALGVELSAKRAEKARTLELKPRDRS
jgi:hypothetical protein